MIKLTWKERNMTLKITSVNNDLVKETVKLQQRKYREESGLFLLEGEKCIEEALEYGIKLEHLFVAEGYDKFSKYNSTEVTEAILGKISTTTSAPKCVAVGHQIKRNWENLFRRVVLLESIKDAGNLGTIIRTSCAFNIDAIMLYGDTVDLYNPKCVRATVGNLWKIPVFNIKNLCELKKLCADFMPVSTLPKSDSTIFLNKFSSNEKLLIMFGTESSGLSDELKDYAKNNGQAVTIEMTDKVESLNLSISVGVVLYKLFTTDFA